MAGFKESIIYMSDLDRAALIHCIYYNSVQVRQ